MRLSIHFISDNGTPAVFHVFAHFSEKRILIVSPPGGIADRAGVVDLLAGIGACRDTARLRIDEAARRHVSYLEL